MTIRLSVNGSDRSFDGDSEMPLLWYLREDLRLKGAKPGCLIASCGACTVHVNGEASRSCSVPMGSLEGAKVETVEALSADGSHPVQRAWIEEDVAQCGYCQTGQIMAVVALLKAKPQPTDADIDEVLTNLCRCGTYSRIRKAVHRAAALMAEGKR
ncbi:MAG: (2Fe-2S)-binding protein [Alphaproteobacteria bacterium]|nr:(2Fe-2S)-binding protein [Alphaproteobacteria bacterium]